MKPVFMAITLAVFCASSFSQGYITPLGQGIEVLKIHGHRDGGITVWVDSSSVQNPDNCAVLTDCIYLAIFKAMTPWLLS